MCDQEFTRYEFTNHHCSRMAAPYRYVIKKQDREHDAMMNTNKKLKAQNEYAQTSLSRFVQGNQETRQTFEDAHNKLRDEIIYKMETIRQQDTEYLEVNHQQAQIALKTPVMN